MVVARGREEREIESYLTGMEFQFYKMKEF